MKRELMSGLLALTMVGTLTACGGTTGSQPTPESTTPGDAEQKLGEFKKTATLAETVMVDEGGVKITATGLNYTEFDVEVKLLIENNSGKDLSFSDGSIGYGGNAVNGMMMESGSLYCNIGDGKKSNEAIRYSYDDLMLFGIDEIADMEIGLKIRDEEYETIYEGIHQLKTSAFDTYDYETNHYQEAINSQTYQYETIYFSTDSLYEQNGVKLLSSSMVIQDGESLVLLELENTLDSMVQVEAFEIAVNGLKLSSDIESATSIFAGNRGVLIVPLSTIVDQAYWSEYGITEVGSVSCALGLYQDDLTELGEKAYVEMVISDENATFDASGEEVYNNNGVRMVSKSLQEDDGDLLVLMFVENNSGKTLSISDAYDSLSVNGFMTDYYSSEQELNDGEAAVMILTIMGDSLEENQITSSDVEEIEIGFEIEKGYTTIDEPTLTLQFG